MSAAITGTASSPGRHEVELSIIGMTCAACAARVQKKLSALDDVTATVNFATGTATVTAPVSVPLSRLIETVEHAGYGADLARPLAGADAPAEVWPTIMNGTTCPGIMVVAAAPTSAQRVHAGQAARHQ